MSIHITAKAPLERPLQGLVPAGRQLMRNAFQTDNRYLYNNKALCSLLTPIIVEQFLNSFMGMADTMMISNIGSTAISAVSLTDSVNMLAIQFFAAIAAGGSVICSQFLGQKNTQQCNKAAKQLLLIILVLSCLVTVLGVSFRKPLLSLVFGSVPADVMEASLVYFHITALSFPFFSLFQGGGALFRACGESRLPMRISVITNLMNIGGNAVLIFVFHMGVEGAALSTLVSRIISAVWILSCLRRDHQQIVIRRYLAIHPDPSMIHKVLWLSIPSGIENGMFQFGKLAIQSSVSTLGTTAIAAQAMAAIIENLDGIAGIGIGIGLMTVVGQCVGAGSKDQAVYYIKKLAVWSEITILLSCLITSLSARQIMAIAGMEWDASVLCMKMVLLISVCKPVLWVPSFIPPYGFRATGDVRFTMMTSSLSMWICRVALTIFMIRILHLGLISVWIGMFTDWGVRGLIYTIRFRKGSWMTAY